MLLEGKRAEAEEAFYEALRLDPQLTPPKIGLGVPAGKTAGLTDMILRVSLILSTLPHRKLLIILHFISLEILVVVFVASTLLIPDASVWRELELVIFLWIVYFLLAGLIVKAIGRRRGVHFF